MIDWKEIHRSLDKLKDGGDDAPMAYDQLVARVQQLEALIDSPHTANFLEAARAEVAHQIEKWGTAHDRAKAPADWYWLLAYLSGKALAAHIAGDSEKAKHHTISSAAVLANWHAAITFADNRMQPGSSDLQQFLRDTFGESMAPHIPMPNPGCAA